MFKNDVILNYFKKQKSIDTKTLSEIKNKSLDNDFNVLDFLLSKKIINSTEYLNAVSYYFNIPNFNLDFIRVVFDIEKYFTLEMMKKHCFVPLDELDEQELIVAISDPLDFHLKSIVTSSSLKKINYVIVEKSKINEFLTSYSANKSTKSALENITNEKKETSNDDDYEVVYLAQLNG